MNSSPSSFSSSSCSCSSYPSTSSFISIPYTCRSVKSHNICFCRIFDIFSTDRSTDRPRTKKLRFRSFKKPSPIRKKFAILIDRYRFPNSYKQILLLQCKAPGMCELLLLLLCLHFIFHCNSLYLQKYNISKYLL